MIRVRINTVFLLYILWMTIPFLSSSVVEFSLELFTTEPLATLFIWYNRSISTICFLGWKRDYIKLNHFTHPHIKLDHFNQYWFLLYSYGYGISSIPIANRIYSSGYEIKFENKMDLMWEKILTTNPDRSDLKCWYIFLKSITNQLFVSHNLSLYTMNWLY